MKLGNTFRNTLRAATAALILSGCSGERTPEQQCINSGQEATYAAIRYTTVEVGKIDSCAEITNPAVQKQCTALENNDLN